MKIHSDMKAEVNHSKVKEPMKLTKLETGFSMILNQSKADKEDTIKQVLLAFASFLKSINHFLKLQSYASCPAVRAPIMRLWA